MKLIAYLFLVLFVSSAFFGLCNGAVWFEGYDNQEVHEIRQLNMQNNIESPHTALPVCDLFLSEIGSKNIELNIIVSTWALVYQNENFETWLSIDNQEPEKLFGVLEVSPSAAGDFYERPYKVTLSGLEDGVHFIKIRVLGEYYGPGVTFFR